VQKGFVVEFVAPDLLERLIESAYATNPDLIAKVRAAYSGK